MDSQYASLRSHKPFAALKDIAAMVGASREVVTRAFRALEGSGTIRVEGRRITLVRDT